MENAATLVIRHRIAQADRPRYEVWLNRIVP
ncbi:antibiotic biosynthesis monooxygenase, partial [Aeromonas sp. HMWF014]